MLQPALPPPAPKRIAERPVALELGHRALLRLLHLSSPALPIGAFAYSQGLETAVQQGTINDEASAQAWILGLLEAVLPALEVPLLLRLDRAFRQPSPEGVRRWNDRLFAARPTRELQAEDRRLGQALARVLMTCGLEEARVWEADPHATQLTLFSLACARWQIPIEASANAFLFTWTENQVSAAVRLIPLGQNAGLRLLSAATEVIPSAAQAGLHRSDEAIGFAAPGQVLASMEHEGLYSRIFRS